ncbi:oxoglutarate 3-dioxygenase [Grosmannia clavigera kw1407]|uniref:Oxoglutarate 3-dioxygenase n=1 Tax=Grosmannia clavigera (strain kw1407 / UAMH 11150) TaxID=655863 RepID=F0XB41_GROCL|nr:oxoglutarate 3-dioxygenase [Grosmannia clavigera kw1407]EFX05092.1 oxoglutarate 3-dioxygenase [Grosmannia clavigera kw1407]
MEPVEDPSVIPVVDFGPFLAPGATDEDRRGVAMALHAACRDVGFFYLRNHGVSAKLIARMLGGARDFFETATPVDKDRIALRKRSEGGDNARGWLRIENAEKGSHEAVDFYRPVADGEGVMAVGGKTVYDTGMGKNQWPSQPSDFKSVADEYIGQLEPLGVAVIRALALGLGVDEAIFVERIDRAFWNLRILAYEGRKERETANAGIGEHTDFGLLTFLLTDSTKKSLQVLSKDGKWVWADPIEGCYLCNIGDMLSTWTHGLYKSTLHRVVHTSNSMRISIPFFFDPNWDAFISPVIEAADNGAKLAPVESIRYSEKFKRSLDVPLWRDPLEVAV